MVCEGGAKVLMILERASEAEQVCSGQQQLSLPLQAPSRVRGSQFSVPSCHGLHRVTSRALMSRAGAGANSPDQLRGKAAISFMALLVPRCRAQWGLGQ